MKIIVCGAGDVGKSIVRYLSQGNNDIIVIDNNPSKLDELSKGMDIQPILGSASHPDILEKAGAQNADMLIAATDDDEVNMIACQVAYSIFNIDKKIARIDSPSFLDAQWSTLYNDKNIPIDLIISPDIAIAETILDILKIPGTSEVLPFADKKVYLLAFRCKETCPLIKTPLARLERIAPDLDISVVSIVRNSQSFIPSGEDIFLPNDEIYLLVDVKKIDETIRDFGMEHNANEKIIIFGGTPITSYIAEKLENNDNVLSCKIIDDDFKTAQILAEKLNNTIVINGEMMSDAILSDAGIENTDVTIAITKKDKDNLLASLLAKKSGVSSTITLVNSRSYDNLVDNIGDNILIDRSAVTISSILQELRRAKISNAYSLGRGFGEIWEIKVSEDSQLLGKSIRDVEIPNNSQICALIKGENIIYNLKNEKINKNDILIFFVNSKSIKKAEKFFS